MIGLIGILAISWILLHFIEKKNLSILGLFPLPKRMKQFLAGFLVTSILCFLNLHLESCLKTSTWKLNENITSSILLKSFWWDFKSVLTEELVFRGALLYILIQKIGSQKGIIISAIAFGVYHWFSYGIIGNLMPMIIVFTGTGLMGYAWAWAFSKTKSIMLAFGLHFGWNFTYNTIFSKGPLGELILISKGGTELTDWNSLLNFLSGLVVVPIVVLIYVRFFVKQD